MTKEIITTTYKKLLSNISTLLEEGRKKVVRQVNDIIVNTYWNIGKQIVEFEQKGKEKAEYGKKLLERLSVDLTKKYGRGFNLTNLKYMRQFYIAYRKSHSLRDQLSWTHYTVLINLELGKYSATQNCRQHLEDCSLV